MPKIHLPTVDEFATQLSTLIGRDLEAEEIDVGNSFDTTAQSAIYLTREDHLAAIARLDLPLSARLGAALAMMPEPTALESIENKVLDGDLLDAYREVVNIMAGLLCKDGAPHVRLGTVNTCDPSLREEFLSTLEEPETRLDIAVDIEGYGNGLITIWTAKLE